MENEDEKWLLNPRGQQVTVSITRVQELITKGYRVLKREEIVAYRVKTPLDAKIVQGQWPFSGYGRIQELLDNNFIWNENGNNLIYIGYPEAIIKEPGKKYILITAWEANRIPPEWVKLLDQYDLIIVISRFCERIFKDSGTTAPVKVMILGTDNFVPVTPPPHQFTYIHYNSFADHGRKGWDLVADAFNQLFPSSVHGVRLILKSRNHVIMNDLQRLPQNKNIDVIVGDYSRWQMETLLTNVNCMVFPSRGEGLGLPPLETMAHGIPTIFTDAYGMTEYEQFGVKVDVVGFAPAIYDFPFDGLWVEPDFDKLCEKMFSVYSHYQQHKQEAIAQVPKIRERFGERAIVRRFKELIEYVS